MTVPASPDQPEPYLIAPDCPRCGRPLGLEPVRDTDRWQWRCTNRGCRYSTTRDRVVEDLLRENRDARELLERYARLSLPGFVAEVIGADHRCPECEARWRKALVAALDRADGQNPNPPSA
jgi:ssDNA-binding Zn-finger/Zn-ribbon topoisomerase 1